MTSYDEQLRRWADEPYERDVDIRDWLKRIPPPPPPEYSAPRYAQKDLGDSDLVFKTKSDALVEVEERRDQGDDGLDEDDIIAAVGMAMSEYVHEKPTELRAEFQSQIDGLQNQISELQAKRSPQVEAALNDLHARIADLHIRLNAAENSKRSSRVFRGRADAA